jgi:hypothetical protein
MICSDDVVSRTSLAALRRFKEQMFWAFARCPDKKWSVLTDNCFASVEDDDDTDRVFAHIQPPQLLRVAEEYRPSQHPNSPIRAGGRPAPAVRQQFAQPPSLSLADNRSKSPGHKPKSTSGKVLGSTARCFCSYLFL